MSLLLRLLAVASLIGVTSATCEPNNPDQKYDPSSWTLFYILPAYDSKGLPCAANYTINMDSTDDQKGFWHFSMAQFDPSAAGTYIDVLNADGTTLIGGINSTTSMSDPYYTLISATSKIQVRVTQYGTPTGYFLGTMERADSVVGATSSTAPPTPVPTTAKYQGTLAHDPKLIALDLMIAVDAGNGASANDFISMKTLVRSIAGALDVRTDINSRGGTRLTLTTISPLDSYHAIGLPWGLDQATFMSSISTQPYLGTARSPFFNTIDQILTLPDSPFSVENSVAKSFQNTRPHAQRVLVIVTANSPADPEKLSQLKDKFIAMDVHPIVLGYKLTDSAIIQSYKNLGWFVHTAADATTADVNSFLADALLDGNKLCTADVTSFDMSKAPVGDDDEGHAHYHFDEPSHGLYDGPEAHVTAPTVWETTGQRGRYCNFQERTYTVTQVVGNPVCFTVFYELEVEKDYLRFYQGFGSAMMEVVSLTGSDVSGSTFSINNNVTIQFSTDGWGVFGGFSVHMENCPTSP